MATKRKRKKSKTKRILFKRGAPKKRRKQAGSFKPSLIGIFKVSAVVCVLAGIVIGLVFLERYVEDAASPSEGKINLELADVPHWVSDQLKEKVFAAATPKSGDFKLDEDAALLMQRSIERQVVWLDGVKVQTAHDCLRIEGRWRKPVALIKSGLVKFYVDSEQVVLDFVPMPDLPIVEIKELAPITKTPPLGQVWQREDLAAAVTVLNRLGRRDKIEASQKPLLSEIASIDVSNFNGRENSRHPHIVLYAKDNTEIIWGAEVGKWQQHLESTDEEKLAKLYGYYREYGTLSGGAKYINLRDPQDKIPLPIDKY